MIDTFPDEDSFQKKLIDALEGRGFHCQEHEDKYARRYIADVSFSAHHRDGWIEVKHTKTPIHSLASIKHFTFGQIVWMKERGMHGCGHCYFALAHPDGLYLWRWSEMDNNLRRAPFHEAIKKATVATSDLVSFADIINEVVAKDIVIF